jgi:hypothetical protein
LTWPNPRKAGQILRMVIGIQRLAQSEIARTLNPTGSRAAA